jgi:hypothetical protein
MAFDLEHGAADPDGFLGFARSPLLPDRRRWWVDTVSRFG